MHRNMNRSGVTLIELLTVITIAGILVAIAFPTIFKTLQSDTTVKSAAKTVIADLKAAQNEAVSRGGGQMDAATGVLVEKSVFVVFPAGTNTYRVWAYTDTDGDGVREDAPTDTVTSITAVTSLTSSVRFGASAAVTKRACTNGAGAPQASGFSFITQALPPCSGDACLEMDGNGFLTGATSDVIYLTNDRDNYAVSINAAGNFTLCKWPQGATAWQIVR